MLAEHAYERHQQHFSCKNTRKRCKSGAEGALQEQRFGGVLAALQPDQRSSAALINAYHATAMLPEHFDKLRQQHLSRKSAHIRVPDAAGDSKDVARATNLGRPSSALAEQKLVHAALPTRSVPARCCLSTGTEERSSRAPRRAARAAHSAMRTQERVRAEARTMELRAVAQLGRAAGRSPAPPLPPRSAAPAAAAAPCAPPYGRS